MNLELSLFAFDSGLIEKTGIVVQRRVDRLSIQYDGNEGSRLFLFVSLWVVQGIECVLRWVGKRG